MSTGTLEHMIRQLSTLGLQINIWPSESGYTANVKERAGPGWTVVSDADPMFALLEAMRQRISCVGYRIVVDDPVPAADVQIDIEDAIAAVVAAKAVSDDDGFEGLLG